MRAALVCALVALVGLPQAAEARNSLVISIPDVSEQAQAGLADAKIKDTRRLYQKTHKGPDQRASLAERIGLPTGEIDRLASVADLCRLYKVTPRVAHLFILAGVTSTRELGDQPAAGPLREEIARINHARRVTENLPTEREVAGWIKDAKVLKPEDWEQTRKWASIR